MANVTSSVVWLLRAWTYNFEVQNYVYLLIKITFKIKILCAVARTRALEEQVLFLPLPCSHSKKNRTSPLLATRMEWMRLVHYHQ